MNIYRMEEGIVEIENAAGRRLKTYWVSGNEAHKDMISFLEYCTDKLITKIREELNNREALKINLYVKAKYVKDKNIEERNFKTRNVEVYANTDLSLLLEELYGKVLKEKSEQQAKGSGWSLKEIKGLELRINEYRVLRASTFIDLPPKIKNTKSVINVRNNDDFCFKYAILSKLTCKLNV